MMNVAIDNQDGVRPPMNSLLLRRREIGGGKGGGVLGGSGI